jgi:hypothetical protein
MIMHSNNFFVHKQQVTVIEMKLFIKQPGVVLYGGPLKANSHIPYRPYVVPLPC